MSIIQHINIPERHVNDNRIFCFPRRANYGAHDDLCGRATKTLLSAAYQKRCYTTVGMPGDAPVAKGDVHLKGFPHTCSSST